jgi:hypothetical protein
MEQLANNVTTALVETISATDIVLSVSSNNGFPSSGNFRILVDSEIMLVTAISGTILTVIRGIEETLADIHLANAYVHIVITKQGMEQFRSDFNLKDQYFSLPLSDNSIVGREYSCTDIPILLRDNGASWDVFGLQQNLLPIPNLIWITQNTAKSDNNGRILTCSDNGNGATKKSLLIKPSPIAPFTFTIGVIPFTTITTGHAFVGIVGRNSGSDNWEIFGISWRDGIGYLQQSSFSGITLNNDNYLQPYGYLACPLYLQIKDDGTNRVYNSSNDNLIWNQIYSEVSPSRDQYGIGIQSYNCLTECSYGMSVIHWSEN